MSALMIGIALVAIAVGLLAYSLLADPVPRISRERRTGRGGTEEPLWRVTYRGFVSLVDRIMKSSGWKPFRASELEMADIRMSAASLVAWVAMGTGVAFILGFLVGRTVWTGLFLAALVPLGAKVLLRYRAGKRRELFAEQMNDMLQLLASSLRSGLSFSQALDSCARDSESPMSDELARIVNENRIGRDLIEAMEDTADRMKCEDFVWIAEAVAITRDSGGNLNEIIDRVAETIRERAEIRERVHAFAAEGRLSSYVLMGLPIVVAVGYSLVSPGYLNPLFTTGFGLMLLAGSAVMFTIAWFWMRAIVDIKV